MMLRLENRSAPGHNSVHSWYGFRFDRFSLTSAMQHLPQYLLLFHGLFPILATVLVWCLVSREPVAVRLSGVAGIVGIVTSLLLLISLIGDAREMGSLPIDAAASEETQSRNGIVVSWSIPLPSGTKPFLSELTWRFDSWNGGLILLLPWVHLTAVLFGWSCPRTGDTDRREPIGAGGGAGKASLGLAAYAAFNLAMLASDWSSLFTGLFLSSGLLAVQMAFWGRGEKRVAARSFMTVHTTGLLLMVGGCGMLIAAAALLQSAPAGPPRDAPGSAMQLQQAVQSALMRHPAATFIWPQYVTLPVVLLVLGGVVCTATFPAHSWLARTMAAADLPGQLMVLVWTKGIVLVVVSVVAAASPEGLEGIAFWWVFPLAVGCLYSSLLLLADEDLPHMLASALLWSNHLWLLMLALTGNAGTFLSLMIPHIAGLVLLAIALSRAGQRAGDGGDAGTSPNGETNWMTLCLLSAVVALSLMPGLVGLGALWTMTRQLSQITLWGTGGHLLLLFVALVALAGLLRMMFRVLSAPGSGDSTGRTAAPEAGNVLNARVGLSWSQRGLLFLLSAVAWIGSLIRVAG
jgi:formate hydrogenlyase subunit 3/multisubunit Na+/H+ antiporter MnhD subunit